MTYAENYVDDVLTKAREYHYYAVLRDKAHYQMALLYRRRERLLGIPVVILTAAVGTAIFATLQSDTALGWQILTGILSVAATILAALQTLLNYGSDAASQESASARYGAIRRKFDTFDLRYRSEKFTRDECLGALEQIVSDLDEFEADQPRITNRIWAKVKEEMRTQSLHT